MLDRPKPVVWVGSSRRELKEFPKQVRSDIGQALYAAQMGETDPAAKPLKGFGGARVMEIIDRYDTNTYRAVYTVQVCRCDLCAARFPKEIQARHCHAAKKNLISFAAGFQKLSGFIDKGTIDHAD